MLINVGGLEQMALLMDGAVIAINPHNGDLQWRVPFKADFSIAVSTPLFGPTICCSCRRSTAAARR